MKIFGQCPSTYKKRSFDVSSIHMDQRDVSSVSGRSIRVVDNRESESEVVEGVLRQMFTKPMQHVNNNNKKKNDKAALKSLRGESPLANALSQDEQEDDDDDDLSCVTGQSRLPPPPPPPLVYRIEQKNNDSPHGTASTRSFDEEKYLDNLAMVDRNAENRDAYIVEKQGSFEAMDLTQWPAHWNKFDLTSGGKKAARRRLALLALIALLVLVFIIGISVGVSQNKKEKQSSQAVSAASSSNLRAPTPVPVPEAPERDDVVAPGNNDVTDNLTEVGEPPVPADEAAAAEEDTSTPAPTECEDKVETDRLCYEVNKLETEPFIIDFRRCEPDKENWVGIYEADLDEENLSDPLLWLWSCNSQQLKDCKKEGVLADSLDIGGSSVAPGFYQAHFIERDGNAPFASYSSSNVFEVSANCSP
jgi:hypothetical protein